MTGSLCSALEAANCRSGRRVERATLGSLRFISGTYAMVNQPLTAQVRQLAAETRMRFSGVEHDNPENTAATTRELKLWKLVGRKKSAGFSASRNGPQLCTGRIKNFPVQARHKGTGYGTVSKTPLATSGRSTNGGSYAPTSPLLYVPKITGGPSSMSRQMVCAIGKCFASNTRPSRHLRTGRHEVACTFIPGLTAEQGKATGFEDRHAWSRWLRSRA